MAGRDQIIDFMAGVLDADRFEDHGPNGLQVPGDEEVSLLASGVSANRETISMAVDAGAQMLVCHHGLFWEGAPRQITAGMKGRLGPLFAGDVSLAAFHLPLDAHPEIGNNALLCGLMGLERAEPFAEHKGNPIGFVGRSQAGVEIDDLIERLEKGLGRAPLVQGDGPATVRSIGVVSGGAAGDLRAAITAGLDAFITGEPSEWAMAEAAEAGVHFISAGHYATETLGIQRLAQLAADEFGLDHEFMDVPNPV